MFLEYSNVVPLYVIILILYLEYYISEIKWIRKLKLNQKIADDKTTGAIKERINVNCALAVNILFIVYTKNVFHYIIIILGNFIYF